MGNKVRDYSIEELNALIESIKRANSLTEEDISKRMGYNEGYISQNRSRGKVSGKFVNSLMREFGISNIQVKSGHEEKKDAQPETNTLGVIKDLAESNKIIAESNRTLARSHEELVKLLKANSGNQDSEENQLIILAYQKVMFRYMARFGATAEGREPGVVLNEMGKTLAESLKVGVKGGKVGSSSDKA